MGLTYIQPSATLDAPQGTGYKYWSYGVMGATADVIAYCVSVKGTTVATYGKVLSYKIDRKEGDLALGTLNCRIGEPGTVDPEDPPEEPLADNWSLGSTRIEIPIEAFCGPSAGADARLDLINLWREEKNADLYNEYKYLDYSSGVTVDISSATFGGNAKTRRMAEMIRSGVQAVPKYYPIVTRVREYQSTRPTPTGKLGYIDTPAEYAAQAAAWVKVGEDISQNGIKNWVVTETWQGADKAYPELYSSNPATRWPIGGSSS